MITGNKGEWSEIYTFFKLLADRELRGGDGNLRHVPNMSLKVVSVLRSLLEGGYADTGESVIIAYNSKSVAVSVSVLKTLANDVFRGILKPPEKNGQVFSVPPADDVLTQIGCPDIKAPSDQKKDIDVVVLDNHIGANQRYGFSIKSYVGSAPSLLNAMGSTMFRFRICGIGREEAEAFNNIHGSTRLKSRVEALRKKGVTLEFSDVINPMFRRNLIALDDAMPDICMALLKAYWLEGINSVVEATEWVKQCNPRHYEDLNLYEIKVKRLLRSVALGLVPTKKWDNRDEATGGYIVVRRDGELVAFYVYNRAQFDDYLFNNTRFERPSWSRFHFFNIYWKSDESYLDMCLGIRFKEPKHPPARAKK